ncbi:MAG TPA: hypothetical protein VFN23_09260 [Ktedonobacteraceae bacterium]|nr:hypothetical protein [Ktedonobacteraceae bacterium]
MQQKQNVSGKRVSWKRSKRFFDCPINWMIYVLSIGFISLSPLLVGNFEGANKAFWIGFFTVFVVLLVTNGGLSCLRVIVLGTFALATSLLMLIFGIAAVRAGGFIAFLGIGDITGLFCLWAMPFFHNVPVLAAGLGNANRYVSLRLFGKEAA